MWLLLSVVSLVLAVMLHGFSSRIFVQLDSVRRFLLVGLPIGMLLTIAALALYGLTTPALAAVALYAFLCELYIFCFTLAMSSISATMLIMLRQRPLQVADLVNLYKPDEMVRLRVDRLVKTGVIDLSAGRLTLTDRGRRLHAAFSILSRFFGHAAR
jgi:hypothetical protein